MLTLLSPAKVNLFLRILNRRPDGYHEIATAMQTIAVADTLFLTLADSDHLSCSDPSIPVDDSNLVMKAVHLFRRKTGAAFGAKIHLQKIIPPQAGLGGGSSNAATTLWGLNALLGKPATENQLMAWSAEIGSDIPFFFSQGSAYCTGRGEKILPLSPFPQMELYIVKPPTGLSTPEVYRRLNVANLSMRDPEKHLHELIAGKKCFFNDLEAPAFEALPALSQLKQELQDCGYKHVIMSGSGSAFFCVGNGKQQKHPGYFTAATNYIFRQSGYWFA